MLSICQLSLESVGGVNSKRGRTKQMDDSPRQTMTDNDKKPINSDTIEDTRWAQLLFSFLASVTDPAELVSPLAATLKPQKKTIE